MLIVLGIVWIGSWVVGSLMFLGASSTFHEAAAMMLVVNGTVALGAAGVIEAVDRARKAAAGAATDKAGGA